VVPGYVGHRAGGQYYEDRSPEKTPDRSCLRVAHVHVSLCQEEREISCSALGERARLPLPESPSSLVRLSAVVPAFAEPDIHSLSQVPADRHRRLSLCSLPVPKQFEGSLRRILRRSVGYRQDLAACALWDSVVVLPGGPAF
jgi:hypothetical protein